MQNAISGYNLSDLIRLLLPAGLGGILFAFATENLIGACIIIMTPLLLSAGIQILRNPILLYYVLFTVNYFMLGITRYVSISGISVIIDILQLSILILLIIHTVLFRTILWNKIWNPLTIGTLIWTIYCCMEVVNPTAVISAWVLSRGLITTGFVISLLATALLKKYKYLKHLFFLLSLFTIFAILKTIIQRHIGFDQAELRWLNEGGAKTHIIFSGIRYFSFFTDAGNMGSNMGAAILFFGIVSLYVKNKALKLYYILIAMGSCYAMFLSGTRGAMIVPLAGLSIFVILNKNIQMMIFSGLFLLAIYIFFAFTSIGQGNDQIRRMRTAFQPSKDASFNVRKENQKKLAGYLKNKPFGEGLGLSGVENQKTSYRFTTSIPNDSWYVKIWVETGIVGLLLYVGILVIVLIRAGWLIMFQIRHSELRGYLTALICGIFGLAVSAYGNAFWGQYPTHILVFTGMALLLNGPIMDQQLSEKKLLNQYT